MTEAPAPPTLDTRSDTEPRKLNMYMLLFGRPKEQESDAETIELFNSIYKATLSGLPQTAHF